MIKDGATDPGDIGADVEDSLGLGPNIPDAHAPDPGAVEPGLAGPSSAAAAPPAGDAHGLGGPPVDPAELVALVQRLIRFRSVNPPGDVSEITDFIEEHCRVWGMEPQRISRDAAKPNLRMQIGAGPGPTFVLYGHTDVVPVAPDESEQWECDPFAGVVRGDRLYGRGAIDSKGTLGAMLLAGRALKRRERELRGRVVLWVVSDGERGDQAGLKFLREAGRLGGDMVIGCEPSTLRIVRAFKGRVWIELRLRGGSSRHALAPGAADNAIAAMIDVLAALRRLELVPAAVAGSGREILGGASLTVTTIRGGTAVNVSPGECSATVDLRMMPGDSVAAAMERFHALVGGLSLDGWELSATPIPGSEREPTVLGDDSPVVGVMRRAMGAAGLEPSFGLGFSSGGVGNFLAMGIPGVYYGPGSISDAHHANESVALADLSATAGVYYHAALAACGCHE